MRSTGPRTDTRPSQDRGQAFTLEGVLGATFLAIALLVALQTTVITPTTGGAVDEDTRSELRQKANDVLVQTANAEDRDLSWYVRYWNPNTRTFYGADRPEVGYGEEGPIGDLGEMLFSTFSESGRRYNLVLRYRLNGSMNQAGSQRMVYQGPPAQHAVVATYTVTLYDDETLEGPSATRRTLAEYDTNASNNERSFYPVPDVDPGGHVYNVVEVRLVVW